MPGLLVIWTILLSTVYTVLISNYKSAIWHFSKVWHSCKNYESGVGDKMLANLRLQNPSNYTATGHNSTISLWYRFEESYVASPILLPKTGSEHVGDKCERKIQSHSYLSGSCSIHIFWKKIYFSWSENIIIYSRVKPTNIDLRTVAWFFTYYLFLPSTILPLFPMMISS